VQYSIVNGELVPLLEEASVLTTGPLARSDMGFWFVSLALSINPTQLSVSLQKSNPHYVNR